MVVIQCVGVSIKRTFNGHLFQGPIEHSEKAKNKNYLTD